MIGQGLQTPNIEDEYQELSPENEAFWLRLVESEVQSNAYREKLISEGKLDPTSFTTGLHFAHKSIDSDEAEELNRAIALSLDEPHNAARAQQSKK